MLCMGLIGVVTINFAVQYESLLLLLYVVATCKEVLKFNFKIECSDTWFYFLGPDEDYCGTPPSGHP